jgi:hypothetical protein
VGEELFHADGQLEERTDGRRDMTKLTVTFSNSSNASKMATDNNTTEQVREITAVYEIEIILTDQDIC